MAASFLQLSRPAKCATGLTGSGDTSGGPSTTWLNAKLPATIVAFMAMGGTNAFADASASHSGAAAQRASSAHSSTVMQPASSGADHGNSDHMLEDDGSPNTAHSLNPVPLIVTVPGVRVRADGILADVAPTVLEILGYDQPAAMTGESLIEDGG